MTNPVLLTGAVSGCLLQHRGSASIHNNAVESVLAEEQGLGRAEHERHSGEPISH